MSKAKMKYLLIIIILLASIFSNSASSSDGKSVTSDIDNFAFKQEIQIPIDTSVERAKFQPIDIKVEFSKTCYAKDEKNNSVRIGM
jgi:hypothetical protein